MKLKTLSSSRQYEWHKHFLWIPKKVRITNDIEETYKFSFVEQDFEYSILWLEYVHRKHIGNISIDSDDWKYIYWKQL